jgi:glycerol-3-phosphate acyltransferase PlsY
MSIAEVWFIVGSYLFGSIPFLYAIAKLKGVDLHRVGSGSVSGTNILQQVGFGAAFFGGLFDMLKGLIPVLVGLYLVRHSGFNLWVVAGGGMAAVAGQMWPIFLRFNGGRGLSTVNGVSLAFAPLVWAYAIIIPIAAVLYYGMPSLRKGSVKGAVKPKKRTRGVPISWLFFLIALPLLGWALGYELPVIVAFIALFFLAVIRRVTAGLRRDWREAEDKERLVLNRFLYDRSRVHEEVLPQAEQAGEVPSPRG